MMGGVWTKVVGAIRKAPTWAWGALAGLGAVTAGYLRLRGAQARAEAAEDKATRAQLDRDTAKADATIAEKSKRFEQLDKERAEVRAEGDDRAVEALEMDDEQTIAWLQRDAVERRKGKP